MGVINAENTLKFRSSVELFNRVKKRLSSFDSQNMIDEGDFYQYVVYVLEQLGLAVYRECEAIIHVRDFKADMPCNFKEWYAAYKVHPEVGFVPSINEQKPWIWYQDNEISQVCPAASGNCKIGCENPDDFGKTKIVVRTFVNGDNYSDYRFRNPILLELSPNVKPRNSPHGEKIIHAKLNEVTLDDEGVLHTRFKHDEVYLQYYGLPFDENFLPMIPDQASIEKAIEYYIYSMLFEEWYLNSSVPNIGQQFQYVKNEYDHKHWPQALYWAKLPSFQRTIQSIRLIRSKGKWAEWNFDRTRKGETPMRGYTGYPII
jgi:hypothetical protein